MNSGVLLLRNTDWNRDLWAQMASYGTTPMDIAKEEVNSLQVQAHTVMPGTVLLLSASLQYLVLTLTSVLSCMQHLRANLPSYEVGLYEQNVLTFLFYTKPELLDMVIFDISSYGLNCWCALLTLC